MIKIVCSYTILIFFIYLSSPCMEPTTLDYTQLDILQQKPQPHSYDLVTLYDPYILNKTNIASHLTTIHEYLKSSGQFHAFLRTQSNTVSHQEEAFLGIYAKIFPQSKDLPSVDNLTAKYLTDDELKEIIWSYGYNVIAYDNNRTYEHILNKSEYKQRIKNAFLDATPNIRLSQYEIDLFSKQLVKSIIKQCKKDYLDQCIESWNFTEILLSKADNNRPVIFLNNSLLSEDYSKLSLST